MRSKQKPARHLQPIKARNRTKDINFSPTVSRQTTPTPLTNKNTKESSS